MYNLDSDISYKLGVAIILCSNYSREDLFVAVIVGELLCTPGHSYKHTEVSG